jgi:hypothetical protein
MQQGLRKCAADEKQPDLVKAAECLHAALEILEEQGLQAQADQLLQVLQKIAQTKKSKPLVKLPTAEILAREGISHHDYLEAHKGNPTALAKFNLVLRRLGYPDHEIWQMLGLKSVMPEQTAKDLLDPNRALGKIHEWTQDPTGPLEGESDFMKKWKTDPSYAVFPRKEETEAEEFARQNPNEVTIKSVAQKKSDFHTKGLTPAKMVENLKHHGTEFNMSNDQDEFHVPTRKSKLDKDDVDPDLSGLLDLESFDIDASDDELMGIEIQEDSLDVFDKDVPLADFEDERD